MGVVEGPAAPVGRIRCQRIRVRQVIGEQTKQAGVRARIVIPQEKPPAEQVLAARAQTQVQEIKIIPNKVIVEGRAHVQVTYVADVPSQPVHHVGGDVKFVESFDIPGAQPGQDVVVQLTVEKVAVHLDENDKDHRVIVVTIIVKIFVKVTETVEVDVLEEAPADLKPVTRQISLEEVVAFGERQVVVSQQVDIKKLFDGVKPCPEKIIDVIADIRITKREVIKNKVIVEGVLTLQIIYVAKTWEGSQPVHHAHVEVPFTEFVHVEGARPDMMVDIQVTIEDAAARVKTHCEISISVVLQIRAQVTKEITKTVVIDITGNGRFEKITLFLDKVLAEVMRQITIRDTVTIPDQKPPAQKVLDAFVVACEVTETEVLANKVIVRGVVTIKVTYVADKPTQPVHAFEVEVPFTTFADIRGVGDDDPRVVVMCTVEWVAADLENHRNVGLNIVVRVDVRATRIVQQPVVICLEPVPEVVEPVVEPKVPEPKVPTPPVARTYTIQAGDTFFRLAQRFGTTVAAIQAANPGVDPNRLQIGQVINIPG